jgi:hypothetical protein
MPLDAAPDESTTAQIEKKAMALGRFISPRIMLCLARTLNPGVSMSEMGIFQQLTKCAGAML